MKKLFLAIIVIFYINCEEFILKAGQKLKGIAKEITLNFLLKTLFILM